jgi:hypothetical protein
LEALPLFTSGRVRLLNNPRLVHQFTQLQRRSSTTGKDSVSHPDHKNAHDDLANATSGVLVLATTARSGLIITEELLRLARTPPNRKFADIYGQAQRPSGVYF